MTDKLLHSFAKNSREEYRVAVSDFKGREYINIRVWYLDDAGDYRPSKKGVSLPVSKIDDLRDAMTAINQHITGAQS